MDIGLGVLLLVVGSALLLAAIDRIKLGKASKTWPAVKGTILHSGVVSRLYRGEEWQLALYRTVIRYMYEVNGKEYKSGSINTTPDWWAWAFGSPGARKKVAKYPQDKTVDVYYNPQSPEKAFLEPGVPHFSYYFSFLGVIALIISLWFFLS
ncbi:MAG: DUF3592 domain-containing protein [Candidatus Hodarchaeales archaeon]|jgi:hypothetical protein